MKFAKPVVLVAAASLAGLAFASGNHGTEQAPASTTAQASTSSDMTDGEVRKVDKEGGKLTLKHGDIKSLDMPGMTMVFSVKDKAVLDTVKAGDKVKFKALNDAGRFTVTEVQVVK